MTDIKDALREYLESSQPVTLEETIESATTQPRRPIAQRPRPVLVASAAAVIVVLVIGSAWLLTTGDTSPVVTQPPQPDSTLPQATSQPTPATTQPLRTGEPKEVAGRWTMYGAAEGLPVAARSLVIGPDGTAWAMTTDQLYRLDGSRWSPMGSQLAFDSNNWIVATPDNGVALPGASGIVIFDGTEWIKTGVAPPPMAAVVTGRVDPHVLGYDSDGDLVDVSFADGSVSVRTASRGANSGSSPSNISVSLTVDVDSQGNAWYGTIEGAWRFEGDTAELIEVGEPGDCCAPLAVDANDNVWIHLTTDTDTGVLVRLSPGGEITRFTAEDGIPFLADFGAIVPTADGTVWLLEHGGGGVGRVAHFNGSGWNSYTASDAREAGLPTMPSGSNFGIVDGPDGSTWTIELYQETEPVLHRFFDGEWRAVPNAGISTSPVFGGYGTQGIAIGPDGSLWIPTSTGVARFQPNGE